MVKHQGSNMARCWVMTGGCHFFLHVLFPNFLENGISRWNQMCLLRPKVVGLALRMLSKVP